MIKKHQPRYLQVKNKIIRQIISGNYPDGTFLPSENFLMEQFKVARNTIRTALKELENENIILKQRGRPSVIQRKYIDTDNKYPNVLKIAWLDTTKIESSHGIHFEIFQSMATLATQSNIQFDYISLPMLSDDDILKLDFSDYAGVLTNGVASSPAVAELFRKTTHLICIDHLINVPAENYIYTNNRRGGYLAAKYLIEQGCRKIFFLGVAPSFYSYPPFGERFQGYQDALLEAGITPDAERIIISCEHNHFHNIDLLIKSRIESFKNCDGIFVITDRIAIEAIFSLQRLGFSIPSDISVIGFDGLAQPKFMHPKLTTIRQPVEKIAEKALDLILNSYLKTACSERLIQMEPELWIGDTVKNNNKKDYLKE